MELANSYVSKFKKDKGYTCIHFRLPNTNFLSNLRKNKLTLCYSLSNYVKISSLLHSHNAKRVDSGITSGKLNFRHQAGFTSLASNFLPQGANL